MAPMDRKRSQLRKEIAEKIGRRYVNYERTEKRQIQGGDTILWSKRCAGKSASKKKRDRHCTEQGWVAQIKNGLVLQTRTNMSENNVNGPKDSTVSNMTKQLPWGKIYEITWCFQDRFTAGRCHQFVEDCEAGTAFGSLLQHPRKGYEVTGLLHWRPWCRSDMRPVLFFAWQKKRAWRMEAAARDWSSSPGKKKRAWRMEAAARGRQGFEEMAGLGDQMTFENVVSTFRFSRCIRQGGVEAPRLWVKMTMQILWNVESEWKRSKIAFHIDTCQGQEHQICSIICGRTIIEFYLTQRRAWSSWLRKWKDGTWNPN